MKPVLTQQVVNAFLERIENMSEKEMAVLIVGGFDDRELLLDIRQARLAEVAAIEKRLGIKPTTAECRRIAKGKMQPERSAK